jgi:hypothetical protein
MYNYGACVYQVRNTSAREDVSKPLDVDPALSIHLRVLTEKAGGSSST